MRGCVIRRGDPHIIGERCFRLDASVSPVERQTTGPDEKQQRDKSRTALSLRGRSSTQPLALALPLLAQSDSAVDPSAAIAGRRKRQCDGSGPARRRDHGDSTVVETGISVSCSAPMRVSVAPSAALSEGRIPMCGCVRECPRNTVGACESPSDLSLRLQRVWWPRCSWLLPVRRHCPAPTARSPSRATAQPSLSPAQIRRLRPRLAVTRWSSTTTESSSCSRSTACCCTAALKTLMTQRRPPHGAGCAWYTVVSSRYKACPRRRGRSRSDGTRPDVSWLCSVNSAPARGCSVVAV